MKLGEFIWDQIKNNHSVQGTTSSRERGLLQIFSDLLKDNSSPFYSLPRRGTNGERAKGRPDDHRLGTVQAEDTVSGDTCLPRSRILTACGSPQVETHPTSCCCPATAVSVFYYDFLCLSFSRPRGLSGGPSASLSPFSLFPEAKHTHARVHSQSTPGRRRVLEDSEEPEPEVSTTPRRHTRDLKWEATVGSGGGVLQLLSGNTAWWGEQPMQEPSSRQNNRFFSWKNFLFCFVLT